MTLEKTGDIIETAEIETVAFAPEEIMVTDEMPLNDLVIVEEPQTSEDYEKTQNLGDFMSWIAKKMNSLPPHSGKTTAGCERVIAHLKMLDKEISRAISRDVDCKLDDQAVEKFRKEIRKMVRQLDKRHKEINDAYDADDEKFASNNTDMLKNAQEKKWTCVKCSPSKEFESENRFVAHMAMEHGATDFVDDKMASATCACNIKVVQSQVHDTDVVGDDKEKENDGNDLGKNEFNVTYHYADTTETPAKLRAFGTNYLEALTDAESKYATDGSVNSVDITRVNSDEINIKGNDNCPNCKIKLWKAAEGTYECISCDKVFEKTIKKEANTPRIQLIMTPLERALTGILINGYVSQGKQLEPAFSELKKAYKLTDREELSIMQLMLDMGYPTARNFMGVPHSNDIEFATNYQA